jgi:hypothetical protein
MPKAYKYDSVSKKYIGEINCQIDPVASRKAKHDVLLMPANATDVMPLEDKEGFNVVWNGSAWEYQEIPQPEPEPEPTPEEKKEMSIAELKLQLASTDYKIIKCSECSLAGLDLPYDIVALHAERQAVRAEINSLENK